MLLPTLVRSPPRGVLVLDFPLNDLDISIEDVLLELWIEDIPVRLVWMGMDDELMMELELELELEYAVFAVLAVEAVDASSKLLRASAQLCTTDGPSLSQSPDEFVTRTRPEFPPSSESPSPDGPGPSSRSRWLE